MNAADMKFVRKAGMLRSTGKNGRKRIVFGPVGAFYVPDSAVWRKAA